MFSIDPWLGFGPGAKVKPIEIWKNAPRVNQFWKNDPLNKKNDPPSGQRVGSKIRLFDLYFNFLDRLF